MSTGRLEGGRDPLERRALCGRQLGRLRLVDKGLPFTRRRLLLPPLPLDRRDQFQRPPGRRAVVVRHPQREVDEHRRQLVEYGVDRNGLDPRGRLVDELDDYSPPARATERDRDDGALRGAVNELVGERPGESARGDERVDG